MSTATEEASDTEGTAELRAEGDWKAGVVGGIVGAVGTDAPARTVGAGALWGVVTWAVLAALVMPVWLSAVGSPANPPFPNFAPPSLLWHLVYGVVLGAVYEVVEGEI